jgi:hypothetical protein
VWRCPREERLPLRPFDASGRPRDDFARRRRRDRVLRGLRCRGAGAASVARIRFGPAWRRDSGAEVEVMADHPGARIREFVNRRATQVVSFARDRPARASLNQQISFSGDPTLPPSNPTALRRRALRTLPGRGPPCPGTFGADGTVPRRSPRGKSRTLQTSQSYSRRDDVPS